MAGGAPVRRSLAERSAVVDDAEAPAATFGSHQRRRRRRRRRRTRGALSASAARAQHQAVVTGDLDAFVVAGAITALAFERTYPPLFGAHRIQRIDACKFYVKIGPGIVVERCECLAGRGAPFALDVAALAPDPLEF